MQLGFCLWIGTRNLGCQIKYNDQFIPILRELLLFLSVYYCCLYYFHFLNLVTLYQIDKPFRDLEVGNEESVIFLSVLPIFWWWTKHRNTKLCITMFQSPFSTSLVRRRWCLVGVLTVLSCTVKTFDFLLKNYTL